MSKGIPKEVKKNTRASNVSYFLHYPVITAEKQTTKIWVVYDALARSGKDKLSLNECLYRGPVMVPELCGIVFRFQTYRYGLIADIKKAFLKIELNDRDRDVTSFLFPKDLERAMSFDNLMVCRFCRIAFGFISSPFLLTAIIATTYRRKSGKLKKKGKHLKRSYHNDWLTKYT